MNEHIPFFLLIHGENCILIRPYSTPSSCLLLPSNDEDETVRNGGIVEKVLTEKGLDCDIVDFPDMPHG